MRMIHSSTTAPQLLPPLMEELEDIEEFVEVLLANFQAASATNFDALTNFKPNPKESLHMLGTEFNIFALSLKENNLISSYMPALALIKHLPDMVSYYGLRTTNEIIREDKAHTKNGKPLTN